MKLNVINTILLVGILSYLLIGGISGGDGKQAYVITNDLFSEFKYQQELNDEYALQKEQMNAELDAMRNRVLFSEGKIKSGDYTEDDIVVYQQMISEFQSKEFAINQQLTELNTSYTNLVWDKLNSLVKTYGDEHGYEVIFGATGTGNIMFAEENLNITKEVIEYCNLEYSGK